METNTISGGKTPPPLVIRKDLDKEYKSSTSSTIAISVLVFGIIMFLIIPRAAAPLLTCGIFMLILSYHIPLKFREDHLIYKPGVATKTEKISFSAMEKIEYEKKKIIIHCGGKTTTIHKASFTATDWIEINQTMKSIKPE